MDSQQLVHCCSQGLGLHHRLTALAEGRKREDDAQCSICRDTAVQALHGIFMHAVLQCTTKHADAPKVSVTMYATAGHKLHCMQP